MSINVIRMLDVIPPLLLTIQPLFTILESSTQNSERIALQDPVASVFFRLGSFSATHFASPALASGIQPSFSAGLCAPR